MSDRRTLLIADIRYANVRGIELYKSGNLDLVVQKILLDTNSWSKTVRAVRETYKIGISLDVRNI